MRFHMFDGTKGEVAIDAAAVVGLIPAESPIGEHSAILLSGGHKVVVSGSVKEVYAIMSRAPEAALPADSVADDATLV